VQGRSSEGRAHPEAGATGDETVRRDETRFVIVDVHRSGGASATSREHSTDPVSTITGRVHHTGADSPGSRSLPRNLGVYAPNRSGIGPPRLLESTRRAECSGTPSKQAATSGRRPSLGVPRTRWRALNIKRRQGQEALYRPTAIPPRRQQPRARVARCFQAETSFRGGSPAGRIASRD